MAILSGVRILSIEQYGSMPFGTQMLRSLGAEVIKIEHAHHGGDVSRHLGPYFHNSLPESARSLFFQSLNAGKKSLTLDLSRAEGQRVFHRLVQTADAVVHNLRGDVPNKLGIGYDQLKSINEAIVCGHLTAYGREGPRASWPGYDYLMQAEAGYFALTGEPDSPPSRMGLSVVDYMTGVVMALGVVSGVLGAACSGKGCDVDTSLYDVALHNLNYVGAWFLNAKAQTERQPRSAHPSLSPCQLYRTADGWIYLMCNKPKFWATLCDLIERPQWKADERFLTFESRQANRNDLTRMLDEVLMAQDTQFWIQRFGGKVPAAPVWSVAEALQSPLATSQGRISTMPLPNGEALRVLASPLRTSQGTAVPAPGPALGADTAQLLAEIGIDETEQARLKDLGVI